MGYGNADFTPWFFLFQMIKILMLISITPSVIFVGLILVISEVDLLETPCLYPCSQPGKTMQFSLEKGLSQAF